ncbi:MAG TPA: Ppx/GppA family phosphatase, partial [Sphingomonas sp.]
SRAVATEACRRATNGADFIARAQAETGIVLDIISAEEEARLAVLGCHALIEPGDDPALVFDIGGGSTELVLIDTTTPVPTVLDWHSAPWGVVSLTESVGQRAGEDLAGGYARMRRVVAESFADFARRLPRTVQRPRLLGTSGTVTTLASVHLALDHYDRSAVDGLIVPATAMRRISSDLSRMTLAERAKVACIGAERADLVVAGCAILETILDLWPAERLGVADRGIREGILRRLMGTPRP